MTAVDRIFELMRENELNAKEFALKVGVSQGNITDWKTGRAKPSVESLQKISNTFNVRLEWLTGDSDLKTTKDVLKEYLIQQDIQAINNAILIYWDDFKKTGIKVSEIDDFINALVLDREKTTEENGKKLIEYVNQFKPNKKKHLVKLIEQIFDDMNESIDSYAIVHDLLNKIDKETTQNLEHLSLKNSSKFYMCPVYGKIAAGIPNWAEECLEGYLPIDPNLMGIINPEECMFLLVNGESMNKVIRNGAYALIRKQDVVENGEIAAVLVNGFEATLKKFSKQGDLVILEPMSDDPSFTTQVYGKDTEIRILGKYIGKFEMNK